MNKDYREFKDFINWVESLKKIDEETWSSPIKVGKWSMKEIICHIWFWDKYTLEQMLPHMNEGSHLDFIDIQTLNSQATDFSKTILDKDELINKFEETRNELLSNFLNVFDDKMFFFIGKRKYNHTKYIKIFTHHDHHHKQQIEEYLDQRNIG